MRKLLVSTFFVASVAFSATLLPAQSAPAGNAALFDRLCGDHGESARHARFQEWIVKKLELNDAQQALFKDFRDARAKSLDDSKAKLCATKPDLTNFEARLDFSQAFLEARLDAMKAENPKLLAFYGSLSDEQKKIFEEIRARARR